jgi:hypothetical protein
VKEFYDIPKQPKKGKRKKKKGLRLSLGLLG